MSREIPTGFTPDIGNILQFAPSSGYRAIITPRGSDEDSFELPVIGWAVVVTSSGPYEDEDGKSLLIENEVQPVVLWGGTPSTMTRIQDELLVNGSGSSYEIVREER